MSCNDCKYWDKEKKWQRDYTKIYYAECLLTSKDKIAERFFISHEDIYFAEDFGCIFQEDRE